VRILLTGRDGQVGWELARALAPSHEVVTTDRATLDLADFDAIRRVVREAKPAVIVNAAAYTAVDRAESEPELAMRVNGEAPGVLAGEAKRLGALLVHYSTDYVFDGGKTSPYVESDRTAPLNVYGRSKLEGEERIRASGARHLVLRTSWVYAPRGRNFFLAIARKLAAREGLRVVDDQTGVPTSARFLAGFTTTILQTDPGAEGLYHLVPDGSTTWCGFARAIAASLAPAARVEAIRSDQYPTAAARPRNSVLDNRRLATRFGLRLPAWEAPLAECLEEWGQTRLSP
jgi:dTDP-4-dehydrorhamnose reductase